MRWRLKGGAAHPAGPPPRRKGCTRALEKTAPLPSWDRREEKRKQMDARYVSRHFCSRAQRVFFCIGKVVGQGEERKMKGVPFPLSLEFCLLS